MKIISYVFHNEDNKKNIYDCKKISYTYQLPDEHSVNIYSRVRFESIYKISIAFI